jgi:hypothetical protein
MLQIRTLLQEALADPKNAWSIGTFGAIGEFIWAAGEDSLAAVRQDVAEVVTAGGGIRIRLHDDVHVLAYETLSSDGESWSHTVAFCLPTPAQASERTVRRLGEDGEALRPRDRAAILFDLGVGVGFVSMCVRTENPELIAALEELEGKPLLSHEGFSAANLILALSPHRVLLSPLARIEVFSSIPAAGEKSPVGPHTHLLPKLIASGRTHGANTPIPKGMQSALLLHPRSPWRDRTGTRTPFNVAAAENFERLFAAFGLPEDKSIRADLEDAIRSGIAPENYLWPQSRRGRAQARITLRKLAQTSDAGLVHAWKMHYDHRNDGDDDVQEPHAAGAQS